MYSNNGSAFFEAEQSVRACEQDRLMLSNAIVHGDFEEYQRIIQARRELLDQKKISNNYTPLMEAIQNGKKEIVLDLLNRGADPLISVENPVTPSRPTTTLSYLIDAYKKYSTIEDVKEIATKLILAGVSLEKVSSLGSALDEAKDVQNQELIDFFTSPYKNILNSVSFDSSQLSKEEYNQYIAICCPIGRDIMENPVKFISNQVYEREEIIAWHKHEMVAQLGSHYVIPYLVEHRVYNVTTTDPMNRNQLVNASNQTVTIADIELLPIDQAKAAEIVKFLNSRVNVAPSNQTTAMMIPR